MDIEHHYSNTYTETNKRRYKGKIGDGWYVSGMLREAETKWDSRVLREIDCNAVVVGQDYPCPWLATVGS